MASSPDGYREFDYRFSRAARFDHLWPNQY